MNNHIEYMEKKVELAKVTAAKMDLELTVLRKLEEVERVNKNISIQNDRIKELSAIIFDLENEQLKGRV